MEIIGNVKNYDWGKLGANSAVAQLASLNANDFKIDNGTPYSELWMGDHSSGPAIIKSSKEELGNVLKKSNSLIGGHKSLPFLFKVLSIRKALSIQVHPNKAEAERLHSERPDIYKDPNHKPELAIALTPFRALCGFRPYHEIYKFCQDLPPLQELLGGKENTEKIFQGTSGLKKCFEILMTSEDNRITACISAISSKYENVLRQHQLIETFKTINQDFPNDVGVLSLFFLNLIQLQPGEAIFLGANEIHAYLFGDCIECMACSDNVIRAGLTPKFKDVTTLIASLNYDGNEAKEKFFQPKIVDEHLLLFSPPVKDFAVLKITLPSNKKEYQLNVNKYGSILLVLNGERTLTVGSSVNKISLMRGSIVFIPGDAGETMLISEKLQSNNFEGYIAAYNSYN